MPIPSEYDSLATWVRALGLPVTLADRKHTLLRKILTFYSPGAAEPRDSNQRLVRKLARARGEGTGCCGAGPENLEWKAIARSFNAGAKWDDSTAVVLWRIVQQVVASGSEEFAWLTEDNQVWLTEDNQVWLLENG